MENQVDAAPRFFSKKNWKLPAILIVAAIGSLLLLVFARMLFKKQTVPSLPQNPSVSQQNQPLSKTPPTRWGAIVSIPVAFNDPNERLQKLVQDTKHLPAIDPRSFFITSDLSLPSNPHSQVFRGVLRKIDPKTITIETFEGLITFNLMNGNSAETTTRVFFRKNLTSYDGRYVKLTDLQSVQLNQAIQVAADTQNGKAYRVELFQG